MVRELHEETGLAVRPDTLAGVVRRGPYRIADYRCVLDPAVRASPTPVPGDDADDARFVDLAGYAELPLVDGLTEALRGWDCLPRR